MEDSILDTIKKLLGIPSSDTAFDQDIIVNINSAFMVLNQLGLGPQTAYFIEDNAAKWSDFLSPLDNFQAVKTYIFLSVRLVFDPPGTSFLIDALSRQKQELEWRLNIQVPIPDLPPTLPQEDTL